jgi:hypothetical protein
MFTAKEARELRDLRIEKDNVIAEKKRRSADELAEIESEKRAKAIVEDAKTMVEDALFWIQLASTEGHSETTFSSGRYDNASDYLAFPELAKLGFTAKRDAAEYIVVSEPHSDFDGINNYYKETGKVTVSW